MTGRGAGVSRKYTDANATAAGSPIAAAIHAHGDLALDDRESRKGRFSPLLAIAHICYKLSLFNDFTRFLIV